MPTKHLPSRPDLEHLKHQVKDLLKAHRARHREAYQRIREFHPRFAKSPDTFISQAKFTLADAQLSLAREYGFPSWARLRAHLDKPDRDHLNRPHHERISDPDFRRAVDLLDAGDAQGLRAHLMKHPGVVRRRVTFEGENYFRNPALLEFAAENPIRRGTLPGNIVEAVKVVLDAGGREDRGSVDATLELTCSGRVPRECGVQIPLVDLLCDYGAGPDVAMSAALGHGEFGAVEALIRRGAKVDLPVAAAMGRIEDAGRLVPSADGESRHRALALAAQHGHAEIVRLLLDAGEDPNRYNPLGCHSHSTPLHQAALAGHEDVVRLLVARGAALDTKDILFHGTPLDWARHAGRGAIEKYLHETEAASDR
jgi:hypothetical protein